MINPFTLHNVAEYATELISNIETTLDEPFIFFNNNSRSTFTWDQ